MNAFWWIVGGLALAWNLLIYPLAETNFVHTQTYAVVDALFLIAIVRRVMQQSRAQSADAAPREETIALAGVSLASFACLLCCLLAPESVLVVGAPGVDAPIPESLLHAKFSQDVVSASDRSGLHVDVYRKDQRIAQVGMRVATLFGDTMFALHPKPVASIAARGFDGACLTLTQPTGAAFLSPVLVFAKTTPIAEIALPSDTFALPARNRSVHAFLVSMSNMRDERIKRMSDGRAGVLFSVSDGNDKPVERGIGFVPDGLPTRVADLVLVPKLAEFADLRASSVPQPMPMIIGIVAYFGAGLVLLQRTRRPRSA